VHGGPFGIAVTALSLAFAVPARMANATSSNAAATGSPQRTSNSRADPSMITSP